MNIVAKVIGKTPPAICLVLGGVGWLLHVNGAGWLLLIGSVLQIAWLLMLAR